MKKRFRFWWFALFLLILPLGNNGWQRWEFWNNYERIVVWDSWTVALPRGGSITYRNQSPRSRPMISPADTSKLLIWQKPDGKTQEYPISQIGAGFNNLELFVRPDGKGVWLTAWNRKQTIAALNLETGRCHAGGVNLTTQGEQDESDLEGIPAWANATKGRSLGRKQF